jgi:hypothetical protein
MSSPNAIGQGASHPSNRVGDVRGAPAVIGGRDAVLGHQHRQPGRLTRVANRALQRRRVKLLFGLRQLRAVWRRHRSRRVDALTRIVLHTDEIPRLGGRQPGGVAGFVTVDQPLEHGLLRVPGIGSGEAL